MMCIALMMQNADGPGFHRCSFGSDPLFPGFSDMNSLLSGRGRPANIYLQSCRAKTGAARLSQ
jgi:hypothetical protein